jgi:hypothetical protein
MKVTKSAFMNVVNSLWRRFAAGILTVVFFSAAPAVCQATLYDNGPDGNIGYYHVNFGSAVANSFVLTQPATVTGAILTLYSVDDRNQPQQLKWTITTEPFGGAVKGTGL